MRVDNKKNKGKTIPVAGEMWASGLLKAKIDKAKISRSKGSLWKVLLRVALLCRGMMERKEKKERGEKKRNCGWQ